FWVCIVSGIGFCVGGVFVPPIIGVGVVLLSGAIAIAKDASAAPVQIVQENGSRAVADDNQSSSNDGIEFDMHVDMIHHHRRGGYQQVRNPSPEHKNNESKENSSSHDSK